MFKQFKHNFQTNFAQFKSQTMLFVVDVDKEKLYNTYLEAFTTAELKQGHTCSACKSFLRQHGNIVMIEGNKIKTIWDFKTNTEYQPVADSLNKLLKRLPITDIYLSDTKKIGVDKNIDNSKEVPVYWEHFYAELPNNFVNNRNPDTVRGEARTRKETLLRAIKELNYDAIESVLELIAQNSLYRGADYKNILTEFLKIKKSSEGSGNLDNFCWSIAAYPANGAVCGIRNTSIGTLLVDITNGVSLDKAVESFERMVAPSNYKRTSAVVTKGMIDLAQNKVKELGYEKSLERRFAIKSDININNLLFVDRSVKKADNIFDQLKEETLINPKTFSKVEEITIENFIKNVIPTANSIEAFLEKNHFNNFVSLIAPSHADAPSMFKWKEPISWCYTNNMADSFKEKVKAAGGNVEGVVRMSLIWNELGTSVCDLDLWCNEPGFKIDYTSARKLSPKGGMLDVDMIRPSTTGIENIFYKDKSTMKPGNYTCSVHNFDGGFNTGCTVEFEVEGVISTFKLPKVTKVTSVATLNLNKEGVFTLIPNAELEQNSTVTSTVKWGVGSNIFHKVTMIMLSPNHWESEIGNKHYMFMLSNCVNDEQVRPFFNEYLHSNLDENRKAFDLLGSRLTLSPATEQLSGLGFSVTQRNYLYCKVKGKTERILKIIF